MKSIENHSFDKRSDIVTVYTAVTNVLENEKIKSVDEFVNRMEQEGIVVDWQPQRKNVTFEIKEEYASSKKRKFRLSNLNKTFSDIRLTKENLEYGFEYTKQKEEKQREQEKALERKNYQRTRSNDFDLGF